MGKEKREKREEAREIKREESRRRYPVRAGKIPGFGRPGHAAIYEGKKKFSALQTKGEVHETRFFHVRKILEILT